MATDPQVKLQRKRERDRRSQRNARERTKARVASLESLVQDMVQHDTTGSRAMLLQEITALKAQRDEYAKALENIARFIPKQIFLQARGGQSGERAESVTTGSISLLTSSTTSEYNEPSSGAASTQELDHNASPRSQISHTDITIAGNTVLGCAPLEYPGSPPLDSQMDVLPRLSMSLNMQPHETVTPPLVALTSAACCECGIGHLECQSKPRSRWRRVNEALGRSTQVDCRALLQTEPMNDDIPIRAVLNGWSAVLEFWGLTQLPLVWEILRGMDEALFAHNSGSVERMAALRIVYRRIAFLCDPMNEEHADLPSWYHPRPGARERFVVHQHRYCSDSFWLTFAQSLRFVWPHSERDCYMSSGQVYEISSRFDEFIGDIKRWTMSHDFFLAYPEQIGDIPVYTSTPNWVSATTQLALGRPARRESLATSSSSFGASPMAGTRHEQEGAVITPESTDSFWDAFMTTHDFRVM